MANPETTPEPSFRIVPMVSHGQEVADLIHLTAAGYRLTHVGAHVYTLKRESEPPFDPDPDRRCRTCNWFEDGNFCSLRRMDVTAEDGADCGLWADPEDCDP